MTEPDPILCSSPPLLDQRDHSPLWIISEQQSPFYSHLLLEIFSFPFLSSESFQGVVYYFFFTSCICQDQKVGLDSLSKSFATWKSSLCFYWSCWRRKKHSHGESSFEKVQTTIPKKLRRSHVSFQSSVHFSTSLYSKLAKLLPILNYPHSCFWKKESA